MEMSHVRGNTALPFIFAPQNGIVRNVQVRVVNLSLFEQDTKDHDFTMEKVTSHDINFSIGDIGPAQGRWLQPPIVLGPGDFVSFNIFFSGLNGFWNENLWVRKKHGEWLQAFRVFRPYTKLTDQKDRDVAYEQMDKDFLGKGEKPPWESKLP